MFKRNHLHIQNSLTVNLVKLKNQGNLEEIASHRLTGFA